MAELIKNKKVQKNRFAEIFRKTFHMHSPNNSVVCRGKLAWWRLRTGKKNDDKYLRVQSKGDFDCEEGNSPTGW